MRGFGQCIIPIYGEKGQVGVETEEYYVDVVKEREQIKPPITSAVKWRLFVVAKLQNVRWSTHTHTHEGFSQWVYIMKELL